MAHGVEILPEFKGSSNAFLVELFAMNELYDERLCTRLNELNLNLNVACREVAPGTGGSLVALPVTVTLRRLAFDFLGEAFRLFPHLDYCALTVPHAYPTFPLLDHFVVRGSNRSNTRLQGRQQHHRDLIVTNPACRGWLRGRETTSTRSCTSLIAPLFSGW